MSVHDAVKVAVCEYLLERNREYVTGSGHPLIPPTAIDWLGDGITTAAFAAIDDFLKGYQ